MDPQILGLQLGTLTIETNREDTTDQAVDGLVNVANNGLWMGADVADAASRDPL